MKNLIMAVMVGSVMSPAAFAAEPATSPMVHSDSQMDMVTAGTSPTVDNSGNTKNFNYSPTVDSFNLNPIGKNSSKPRVRLLTKLATVRSNPAFGYALVVCSFGLRFMIVYLSTRRYASKEFARGDIGTAEYVAAQAESAAKILVASNRQPHFEIVEWRRFW
jgi:hypothetical protein